MKTHIYIYIYIYIYTYIYIYIYICSPSKQKKKLLHAYLLKYSFLLGKKVDTLKIRQREKYSTHILFEIISIHHSLGSIRNLHQIVTNNNNSSHQLVCTPATNYFDNWF